MTFKNMYLGYKHETGYGVDAVGSNNVVTYVFGITPDRFPVPYPKNIMYDREPGKSATISTSGSYKMTRVPDGEISFAPTDGIPFSLAMGGHAMSGLTSGFSHSITFGAPGHTPKTVTMYHEVSDGAEDYFNKITGVNAKSISIGCGVGEGQDVLKIKMGVTGHDIISATSGVTTKPDTAISGARPYIWGDMTHTSGAYEYGGSTLIGLRSFNISFDTGYEQLMARKHNGTKDVSYKPYKVISTRPARPIVTVKGHFETKAFITDLSDDTAPTRDLKITFYRGTNDHLTINALDCTPIEADPLFTPPSEGYEQTVQLFPVGGFNVGVVDALGSGFYSL